MAQEVIYGAIQFSDKVTSPSRDNPAGSCRTGPAKTLSCERATKRFTEVQQEIPLRSLKYEQPWIEKILRGLILCEVMALRAEETDYVTWKPILKWPARVLRKQAELWINLAASWIILIRLFLERRWNQILLSQVRVCLKMMLLPHARLGSALVSKHFKMNTCKLVDHSTVNYMLWLCKGKAVNSIPSSRVMPHHSGNSWCVLTPLMLMWWLMEVGDRGNLQYQLPLLLQNGIHCTLIWKRRKEFVW